ncbi:MAG: transglutaminaseTgpA domain-containing protein, partial [Caldimicrobium sp.]
MEKLLILISLLPPFLCLYGILSSKFYYLSLFFIGLAFILDVKGFYFPRWIINLLGLVFIFIFFLDVSLENFLEKSLQTLLLFLGLKLLEKKKLRDYFQIYLLEFLLLAGASFYYSALWFFLALLFQVFYIGLALFIHLYLEEGEINKLSWSELKYIFFNFGILFLSTLTLGLVFFL